MDADTGLIVPFPELEPVVRAHRMRHDPQAVRGAPAHVTIHFPWIPAAMIDASALDRVAELAASTRPFAVTFTETRWFDDGPVLWLAPTPDHDLVELSKRSAAMWPEAPLYGGAIDEITPHLTIGGVIDDGDDAGLRAAEQQLAEQLPIRASATEIWWMRLDIHDRWNHAATFPLGG